MRPNLFSKIKFFILENQMSRNILTDLKDDITNNGGKFEIV